MVHIMNDCTPESLQAALELGRDVLHEEARALSAMADALGEDFLSALKLLIGCRGRVCVTGIGKSGHIGKKIAATMNSTGTPSYFVHPTEASHGDLGSVRVQDVVLALSNSGESYELTDMLDYAARRSIPVISITKRKESFLGRQSDVVLTMPDVGEAGPLGCAPTTSTTMTRAMGDAMAMALLHMRGFTREDFSHFHPGGQLGRRLMLVEDIMHSGEELPLADKDTLMSEALFVMTGKGFGVVAIVDGQNRLLGLVSDGDLRRNMQDGLLARKTGDIMTADPVTINAKAPASKALALMNQRLITSVLVVDDDKAVIGLVHMHDCLRAGLE